MRQCTSTYNARASYVTVCPSISVFDAFRKRFNVHTSVHTFYFLRLFRCYCELDPLIYIKRVSLNQTTLEILLWNILSSNSRFWKFFWEKFCLIINISKMAGDSKKINQVKFVADEIWKKLPWDSFFYFNLLTSYEFLNLNNQKFKILVHYEFHYFLLRISR